MEIDTIIQGDCLPVMAAMPANTFDTVITDPPYGLRFMGKKWDYDIPSVAHFAEMLRVAKPGAYLLCFGGTRTFHRMACNLEDAGWEIKDTVMYLYGSGFPKATDVSKMIDYGFCREELTAKLGRTPTKAEMKTAWEGYREVVGKRAGGVNPNGYKTDGTNQSGGAFQEGDFAITAPASPEAVLWNGWKTALKPAFEPIIVAMKPLDGTYANNAMKWGVAGFWIEGGRIPTGDDLSRDNGGIDVLSWGGTIGAGKNEAAKRKEQGLPFSGRFPANIIHDGSEEVLREFPEASRQCGTAKKTTHDSGMFGIGTPGTIYHDDTNCAARFFYTAKVSKAEREMGCEGLESQFMATMGDGIGEREHNIDQPNAHVKNPHPTVKPLSLMRYLVKLTKTPTGGIVLDPYGGSGTTGMACKMEGRHYVLIEQDEHYCEIAKKRIAACKPEQQPMS